MGAAASTAHAQPACDALLDDAKKASYRAHRNGERRDLHIALEKSREARACFGTDDSLLRARAYNFEVYALHKLQRFGEARAVLDAFFETFPVVLDSALWARMYDRSGFVAERLGAFADAQHAYAQSARYAPALPLHRRAEIYASQPDLLDLMGDDVRALALYERLADLLRAPAEKDSVLRSTLGWALWKSANILMTRSRDDDQVLRRAEASAREALQILAGGGREAARQHVFATITLARILDRLGETEEPRRLLTQAVRDAGPHTPFTRMQAWYYLGRWQVDHGEPEAALATLQRGLDIALDYGEQREAQYAFGALGEAHEALGHTEKAAGAYEAAIERAERHRASLGTTTWAATAFVEWQEPYRRLARLRVAQGQASEAFTLLERTRARALLDLRKSNYDFVHLDDTERIRLDSLDREIERLREVVRLDPRPSVQTRARLTELEAERYGTTDSLNYTPPTPGDVQAALAPHQVLLSYLLGEERSHVFVLEADTFQTIPLEVGVSDVDSLVRAISPLWQGDAPQLTMSSVEFETGALHALHAALVAPVASLLRPESSLVIIPDGRLVEVPFAMLLEAPAPRFQYADAPFLVRRHPITTELAASMLIETGPRPSRQPLDMLALGRSDFSAPASAPRVEVGEVFPDLPVVKQELREIASRFPGSIVALNAEATEAKLNDRIAEASVVHLASHAIVNETQPLYSYIDLWPDTTLVEDGRLYLYELAGRQLGAALVVLSGCSTARGQVLAGEGMNGLQYAFRAAGAGASIATLWHVDDEASGRLMERFYVHLRGGFSKDRALRQAQLDYLAEARGMRASPFYWAAPVLYGDPAPIAWTERPLLSSVGWVGLGLVLLALGLALPHLSRRRS